MGAIRATVLALVVMLAGGCFFAADPLIAPGAGEDVGDVLRYMAFQTRDGPDAGFFWEFRRVQGADYEMFMGDANNEATPYFDERGSTLIRLAGDRHGEPIYLIQVDMRSRAGDGEMHGDLVTGFVAIRGDGVGVHAVLDCFDPGLARLAAQFGMMLPMDFEMSSQHVCGLNVAGGKADPMGFFAAAMQAGLVGWEDEMGLSLFEEIGGQL